jgi:hypothetical protein
MDVIWWATAVAGGVAINLIASELFAWGPRLSECLMQCAVRRLAPEMQERMQEEWSGHLQTIPPGLWRIVAAAGFYLATHEINVALRIRERARRQPTRRAVVMFSGGDSRSSPLAQGSLALANHILPGNHHIDMIVLTHPDDDHRSGVMHLIECKTFRDRGAR